MGISEKLRFYFLAVHITKKKEIKDDSAGQAYDFFFFFFLTSAPLAHGSCWARNQIVAAAAGLSHSHSNTGSKLQL